MLLFRLTLFFSLFSVGAFGQNSFCGAHFPDKDNSFQASVLISFQKKSLSPRSSTIDSVPLSVHIVQQPGKEIPIHFPEIQEEIEKANEVYSREGIAFFMCGSPRIIKDYGEYTFDGAEALNNANYVPNTINLYYVDSIISPTGGSLCGLSKYPYKTPIENRYVMLTDECASNGTTLIHELGHFYGLFHTHETYFGHELVDQSNCEQAGDLLCDTPADPTLNLPGYMDLCTYIGRVVDRNGDRYRPEVSNFMSYAPYFCQSAFTDDQFEIIRTIHQNQNNYLTSTCEIPQDILIEGDLQPVSLNSLGNLRAQYDISTRSLTQSTTVLFRVQLIDEINENQSFSLYEEEIELLPGAQERHFDLNLSMAGIPVSGHYNLVAEIDANYEVIEKTEANNIYSSKITVDNQQLSDLILFPNPTADETFLFFRNADIRGNYTIRVFSSSGTLMQQLSGTKLRSEVLRRIDVSTFPSGLYWAHIEFEDSATRHSYKFIKN